MNPVLSILERNDLSNPDQIRESLLEKWSVKRIEDLIGAIYEAAVSDDALQRRREQDAEAGLGASTFVSSLSLSGTSGCAEIGCRARRAATLARYAALYADLVIAPIQIADPHHTPRARSAREEDDFRYQTAGTVLCIRELGPVIDAGLARVIAPELYFCPGCKERAAARVRRVRVEARKLASRNRRSFSIACVSDAPTTVRIRGPQEYCEHPEFFRIFPKRPEWLPNLGDPDGTNLPPRVLRNSKIVDGVFSKIAGDVVLQAFLGSRYDAKSITSNPGELALL